jgi:integrase/recombinase XerC
MPTIAETIDSYLQMLELARSENTLRTYRNALSSFTTTLVNHKISADKATIQELSENAITWFITDLQYLSPSTERLYLVAVSNYFEYLAAENLLSPNLPRIRLFIRQRGRRPGQRLPQFPRDSIENLIDSALNLANNPVNDDNERLRNFRDRAFIITLADTGLRVHEACALRRGDIDWNEGKAIIIGKGNREAVVRFSSRSLSTIREYITARAEIDGNSGRPLSSLPLFARHDRGAGKKVKPITTTTGRNIIAERVSEALGETHIGTITPHSLRHYFVTTVLRASGNMKLAQELARHRSIVVTQRYTHLSDDELDRGYWNIFDENDKEGSS